MAQSELFGHVRGAFTGATAQRKGYFLAAQGGVLFLDEIGELTLDMQAKLLRVLEEREVLQVGADRTVPVDVRVIAATNRDIAAMVREGRFRTDLLFRLDVLSIRISPFPERPEDLRPLVEHFAKAAWAAIGLPPTTIDADFIHALALLPLRGNVREVQNLITFAAAHKADGGPLGLKDLSPDLLWELSRQGVAQENRRAELQPPARDSAVPTPLSPRDQNWHLAEYLERCERDIIAAAMCQARNRPPRCWGSRRAASTTSFASIVSHQATRGADGGRTHRCRCRCRGNAGRGARAGRELLLPGGSGGHRSWRRRGTGRTHLRCAAARAAGGE
jgi:transcriptional regulator with GAF, ATPase, and Fis domain